MTRGMKMTTRSVFFVLCMATVLPGAATAVGQSTAKADSDAALPGDWRGNSTCLVRPSGCNDEESLYHVARIAGKPGWISLQGDKIVGGKAVTMGTVECRHDAEKHTLLCELGSSVLDFVVQGAEMQGTMKLKDGTPWRKISLKKVEKRVADRQRKDFSLLRTARRKSAFRP